MDRVNEAISWYQQKIGAYDKQLWERSVEQKVLQSINNVPKKTTKVKSELIDLDLVRGSTFPKAKPQHSWFAVCRSGLFHVIFMPIYYEWWVKSTCTEMTALLLFFYVCQIATMIVYVTDSYDQVNAEDLSLAHFITPLVMVSMVGLVHAHIVSTQESARQRSLSHNRSRDTRSSRSSSAHRKLSAAHHTLTKAQRDGEQESQHTAQQTDAEDPARLHTSLSSVSRKARVCTRRRTNAASYKSSGLSGLSAAAHTESSARRQVTDTDESDSENTSQLVKLSVDPHLVKPACAEFNYKVCTPHDNICANSDETISVLQEPVTSLNTTGTLLKPAQDGFILGADVVEDGYEQVTPDIPTSVVYSNMVPESCRSSAGRVSAKFSASPSEIHDQPRRCSPSPDHCDKVSSTESSGDLDGFCQDIYSCEPTTTYSVRAYEPQTYSMRARDVKRGRNSGSQCDTDGEPSPKTQASQKSSELEWEQETLNSDLSTCGVESSSNGSSNSDQEEGAVDEEASTTTLPHVASIMNNLGSSADKVSCIIWEGDEVKKAELTVLDVGWSIIQRVDRIPETADYMMLGLAASIVLFFMPCAFRLYQSQQSLSALCSASQGFKNILDFIHLLVGDNWRQIVIVMNGMVQRIFLASIFFFLLSVVEKTFKQRLLYAKHFCYLTSSRRARKYELPHFRLNKVRNIKTWLSLRSYLKKRGPQRSVDSIVSAAFLLAVLLVSVMCFQLLQDYGSFLDHLGNWDLLIWSMVLGLYLLRFMTLGTKINKKYRNFAVLITEQINLYLHMEQKPYKKDELMLANNVLKLAEDLLKELESPFKISGMSANPFLYNITKVIILSAFSAVLTELLGFKLKLYKIKIRT